MKIKTTEQLERENRKLKQENLLLKKENQILEKANKALLHEIKMLEELKYGGERKTR